MDSNSFGAWVSGDVEALVVVLTGDLIMSMLPISLKCHRRDVVACLCASFMRRVVIWKKW